jgi:hypothetical protein
MTFRLASHGGTSGEEWIAADGTITAETGKAFRQFVASEKIQRGARYEVYLNSPGGNLLGGIILGEAIREFGLGTRVARSVKMNSQPGGYPLEIDAPGRCYSACSFAFLGGKWRIAPDRTIGVHQYYKAEALTDSRGKEFTAHDLSEQQIVAGVLADYVVRMGVDARFLTRASMTTPTEMYLVTSSEMKAFAITWSDVEYSDWILEPYKDGIIAVSKTRNGENVATLICLKDRVVRLSIAVPNRSGRTSLEGIVEGSTVDLFGSEIPVENISIRIDGQWIRMDFRLPPGLDPNSPQSTRLIPGTKLKGMSASGATRFWFYHDLPDSNFIVVTRLVGRNCI